MAESILKKSKNNKSNLSSKRELLLILFLGVVFGFLILSMIFSYYLTFFKHEETIRNLKYFSLIDNSLSSFQLNLTIYSQENELKNKKKASIALTDFENSVEKLTHSINNLANYSDNQFEEVLLEQLNKLMTNSEKIIIEGERFFTDDIEVNDYPIYVNKLESEIDVTLTLLGRFKETYVNSVDYDLDELKTIQNIRITITSILFIGIIFWLYIYMRRNTKSQNQIKESEVKYKGIFKNSPLGIFHYNSNSVITDFNDKFVEILGSDRKLLLGLDMFQRLNDKKIVEAVRKSLIDGEGYYEDLYTSITSGKKTFVKAYFKGIRNEKGIITEGMGIVEDISAMKEVEESLKKSLIRNRAIISAMPDILLHISHDGTFIDYSSTGNKNISWLPKGDNIKHVSEIFPEAVASLSLEKIEVTLGTGEMQIFEYEVTKNEETLYLETRMVKSSDRSVLAIIRDVTEERKTAELLKASQERYETFINETQEGIYRIEFTEPLPVNYTPEKQAELYYRNGYFAECNKALLKMYGVSDMQDLVGHGIEEFHKPEKYPENFNQTVTMMRDRYRVTDQQTKETDNKGEIRYFVNNAFGIVENNHLLRIWGTQRDITRLVEAEEEKEVLQKAVEQSQVSIVITDLSGNIEYVNPKFEEVSGYTFEEVLGRNPNILKSGLTDDAHYKELWNKISNGENWSGVFHNRKKNGELFFESATISPISDEYGNVKHFVAVKEDITELTKAQLELKNYKEYLEDVVERRTDELKNKNIFLRTLIDTIPNPVFVKDREKKYTDVNKAFIELFDKDYDELIGHDITKVADPDIAKKADLADKLLLESHGKQVYETLVRIKNNVELPVMIYKASFGSKDEEPEGIVGLIVDISESKKIQAQISKALEREKELNEMKTNFISLASHELRTPLTAIYSSTELIEKFGRKWEEEKYLSHISRIKYSVEGLTDLMEDLLTLSRVDTGKIDFNPHSLNLQTLIKNNIASLEPIKTDQQKFNIQVNLKSDFYLLDEKLIKYIVQNLLSNAIKYSPDGGEIKFEVHDDENNIHMKIRDEGIGIPKEDMVNLFEPFHRGKNVGSLSGTGLGLSIVKEAVTLHRGHINVKSEINKYTEISISLPIIN